MSILRNFFKALFVVFAAVFVFYLLLPTPKFPAPPPDAYQSGESADTETPLRRAYFTNFTRQEVVEHYQKQFERSPFLGITLPTYRLNHPPEDAFRLVRDQTRSTFLEEIVHPFRESLLVNGFKPTLAKDEIWYKGVHYEQKITIKYVPSSLLLRLFLGLASLGLVLLLVKEWVRAVIDLLTPVRARLKRRKT